VRAANPECEAWVLSGCNPDLAGQNPALAASIEDVADLADGRTRRDFKWDAAATPEGDYGGVIVQLWTAKCTEIAAARWSSVDRSVRGNHGWTQKKSTTFVLPPQARWMTVTTNDTVNIEWTLT